MSNKETFETLVEINKAEFNRFRKLLDVGRTVKIVFDLLDENEQNKIIRHYREENILWLNLWLKRRRNAD